jgi:hypothetical protein
MQINAEAGARALFDVTFQGTLPLLPTWEEQPEAFKDDLRKKAAAVASAAIVPDADEALPLCVV